MSGRAVQCRKEFLSVCARPSRFIAAFSFGGEQGGRYVGKTKIRYGWNAWRTSAIARWSVFGDGLEVDGLEQYDGYHGQYFCNLPLTMLFLRRLSNLEGHLRMFDRIEGSRALRMYPFVDD